MIRSPQLLEHSEKADSSPPKMGYVRRLDDIAGRGSEEELPGGHPQNAGDYSAGIKDGVGNDRKTENGKGSVTLDPGGQNTSNPIRLLFDNSATAIAGQKPGHLANRCSQTPTQSYK